MRRDWYDKIVVIDGETQLENVLDGDCTLSCMIDGEATEVIQVGGQDYYTGEYEVRSIPWDSQTKPTHNKVMADDLTVLPVQYFETSNDYGYTVYIGMGGE